MNWDQTLELLKADRGNWGNLARTIGITPTQVRRIASGETTRPRIDTAQKIAAYYEDQKAAA